MDTNKQPVPHVSPVLYASVFATASAILHKTTVDIIQQLGRLVDDTPEGKAAIPLEREVHGVKTITVEVHPDAELIQHRVVIRDEEGRRLPANMLPLDVLVSAIRRFAAC